MIKTLTIKNNITKPIFPLEYSRWLFLYNNIILYYNTVLYYSIKKIGYWI